MPTVLVSINNSSGYFQFSGDYPYNLEHCAFIPQFLDLWISDTICGHPVVKDGEYSMLAQAWRFSPFTPISVLLIIFRSSTGYLYDFKSIF